jgi:hypothetical protein
MSNNYVRLHNLRYDQRLEGDARDARLRCAQRLLAMRESLQDLRARKNDGSLLLATWNIRDFDSNKFGYGHRLPDCRRPSSTSRRSSPASISSPCRRSTATSRP